MNSFRDEIKEVLGLDKSMSGFDLLKERPAGLGGPM